MGARGKEPLDWPMYLFEIQVGHSDGGEKTWACSAARATVAKLARATMEAIFVGCGKLTTKRGRGRVRCAYSGKGGDSVHVSLYPSLEQIPSRVGVTQLQEKKSQLLFPRYNSRGIPSHADTVWFISMRALCVGYVRCGENMQQLHRVSLAICHCSAATWRGERGWGEGGCKGRASNCLVPPNAVTQK